MKLFGGWLLVTVTWFDLAYAVCVFVQGNELPIYWDQEFRIGIVVSTLAVSVTQGTVNLWLWTASMIRLLKRK